MKPWWQEQLVDEFINGLNFRPEDFGYSENRGRFHSIRVVDDKTKMEWIFSNFTFWSNKPTHFYLHQYTLDGEDLHDYIRFSKADARSAWFCFDTWKNAGLYNDRKRTLAILKEENDKARRMEKSGEEMALGTTPSFDSGSKS